MHSYSDFEKDFILNLNQFLNKNWCNVPLSFTKDISECINSSIQNALFLNESAILSLFPEVTLKDEYSSTQETIIAIKAYSQEQILRSYISSKKNINYHYDNAILNLKKLIEKKYPNTNTDMRSIREEECYLGFKSFGRHAGMSILDLSEWLSYRAIINYEDRQHINHVQQLVSALTSYKIAVFSDIQFKKMELYMQDNNVIKNNSGIDKLISACLSD